MSDRSNILKVFNPPRSSSTSDQNGNNTIKSNVDEECIGCSAFSSLFSLIGGSYLLSGYPTRKSNPKWTEQEYNKIHPKLWRTSLRSVGGFVVLFGLYRSFETYRLWKKLENTPLQ